MTFKTLSRIANWENMTEQERERTMRVLAARNRCAIAVSYWRDMRELTLVNTGLDLQNKLTRYYDTHWRTSAGETEGSQTDI